MYIFSLSREQRKMYVFNASSMKTDVSWHYTVTELKTARLEDFHDVVESPECQIVLHITNYSSVSSYGKGTQCFSVIILI